MFVSPMLVIMVKLLNDEGIIHLWKPASPAGKNEDEGFAKKILARFKKVPAGKTVESEKDEAKDEGSAQ